MHWKIKYAYILKIRAYYKGALLYGNYSDDANEIAGPKQKCMLLLRNIPLIHIFASSSSSSSSSFTTPLFCTPIHLPTLLLVLHKAVDLAKEAKRFVEKAQHSICKLANRAIQKWLRC